MDVWFGIIVGYTIYLNFPTTVGQYHKVCGGLHKLFEGIFRVNMMNEIEKERPKKIMNCDKSVVVN